MYRGILRWPAIQLTPSATGGQRNSADLVLDLWDCMKTTRFRDKQNGVYLINQGPSCQSRGRFFGFRPLMWRDRRRTPVWYGGVSSPSALAARTAEVVHGQPNLTDGRSYADLKGRMTKFNRHPNELIIMPASRQSWAVPG